MGCGGKEQREYKPRQAGAFPCSLPQVDGGGKFRHNSIVYPSPLFLPLVPPISSASHQITEIVLRISLPMIATSDLLKGGGAVPWGRRRGPAVPPSHPADFSNQPEIMGGGGRKI